MTSWVALTAMYRARVSCPGWAMLFASFMTLINICNATKKLLGHRSVGSCKAVGEDGFLSCCSRQSPADVSCQGPSLWDSSQNKGCLGPQLPTDHRGVPPRLLHFPGKGAASWREDKGESLSLTCLSCWSQQTRQERCWLSWCCGGP